MIKQNELKGIACVILSGFFYGFVGYFGIGALETSLSLSTMLFWRFFIAALFIGIFLIPQLPVRLNNIPAALSIFTAGALFYGTSTFAYFSAIDTLGTGMAMVIFFVYPAIVILCNWLLYRKMIGKSYVAAIILISIGILFLTELEFGVNLEGVFLSLFSACGYAFYIVASKKNTQFHPLVGAWLVSAGCCIFALAVALFNNALYIPNDVTFWLHITGLGIFSTALPILFLLQGLKFISSEKAAILGVLEPVFVAITGVLLLGEELRWVQIIGIVILLTGAVMSLVSQTDKEINYVDR